MLNTEQKLKAIVHGSPVPQFVIDRDHRVIYWNRALELLTGISASEVSGTNQHWRGFYPVQRPCLADLVLDGEFDAISDLYDGKVSESTQVEGAYEASEFFPALGESGKWLFITAVTVQGDDGEVVGAMATLEDITGITRALEAARESESRLKALSDSAQDAILMIDPKGNVSYWNPAAERIFGYTAGEAMGRNLHGMLAPERYQEAHRTAFEEFQRSGTGAAIGKTLDLHAKRKDGTEIDVSLSLSAVHLQQAWHAIGILRDTTDKRRAEEELICAKNAAESASRLKSEFLANMSHEIRTPMNGVIGMAELLMDTELSQEQREYVHAVKSSAEALMTIINDILDFSKIEARKLDIESVDFNLRDSLGDILHTLTHRAEEKGLELACHVPPDVPDAVIGDPGRLRQVIVNLVGNAIKFTDAGEVVVSVTASEPAEDETLLHFTVTDTGIGIAIEKQQRIFDSFTQADASTTRRYGGTGLGLTISARLVDLMGGRIWMVSEPGKGSAFHFVVRLGVRRGAQVRRVPEKLSNLEGLPVLVVDDNATNRRILEEMLKNWRMKPSLADSGEAALEMLARAAGGESSYRLLILDINMPVMDGFELAERIRTQPAWDGSAIIVLTSSGMRGDSARCRDLGIAAYLTKPAKQSSLLDAIMTVLGTTEPTSSAAPLVTRHTLREEQRPLHILLAEDNGVNRKIALGMLVKRGHSVVAAENGKAALAALESAGEQPYDLILMDVQMPEMDGLEATSRIREVERLTGGHIPIIALTAHAMKGDREVCLKAGMDDYVSKPLKADELLAAMERVVGHHREISESTDVHDIDGGDVFDRKQTLAGVDADMELLKEVVELFLEEYPKAMEHIRDAIVGGDSRRLNRAAHALKGSVSNFGARNAFDLALRLELMGNDQKLSGAEAAYSALAEELQRLSRALKALMAESSQKQP